MSPAIAGTVRVIWPDDGTLSDATGTVDHAAIRDSDGQPALLVRWDDGRTTSVADVSWLARGGVPLTPFGVSIEAFGCAWWGDVREVAAWHAEAPGTSGWWSWKTPARCDRCGASPAEIPWARERLCWPCADHRLGQIAGDIQQPYGIPVHVGGLR